jgi:hypothetical protein
VVAGSSLSDPALLANESHDSCHEDPRH